MAAPQYYSSAMHRNGLKYSRKRLAVAVIGLGLIGVCAWALFGRRQSALDRWMAEMRAKGEKLTITELGLNRPPRTNAAMEVIETAASRFKALDRAKVVARFESAEAFGSAHKRVEWAQTNLNSTIGRVLDWDALGGELTGLRPVLTSIHAIMSDPPLDSGRDYTGTSRTVNFVAMRGVAQSLHDITMYDLHRGNISLAHQDLLTLVGMAHLHTESWHIVEQMIRSAIAGLAVDAVWNALQAPGWTDQQLSELQTKLANLSFFNQLAQAFCTERAVGLYWYNDLKTNRNSETRILGSTSGPAFLPESALGAVWKSLWADQDLLLYCQHFQTLIDSLHSLADTRSYDQIGPQLAATHKRLERKFSGVHRYRYLWSGSAIPNFQRIPDVLVKNETLRQFAVTAIALKRFELHQGKPPGELNRLQPQFLPEPPVDLYDGRPVRYRLDADGGFTLYSVGADFQDDGGAPGKDLLWPKPIWPAAGSE
jgi:hypothetical protein